MTDWDGHAFAIIYGWQPNGAVWRHQYLFLVFIRGREIVAEETAGDYVSYVWY